MKDNQNYPGNYFRHFLEMLKLNYSDKRDKIDLSEENVNDLILMYVHTEGEEEFQQLKKELAEIAHNKDLKLFQEAPFKNIKDLELIAAIVLKHH